MTYNGIPIDEEDEFGRKRRKPRGPKRAAEDTRTEFRLARPDGLFWKGPPHRWPHEDVPVFDKAGQKWASKSRALQLWADYNIARTVQNADWPDLHLEAFEVTIKRLTPPTDQPVDTAKVAHWYARFQRYDPTLRRALELIKSGYNFAYLMEYWGDGTELSGVPYQMKVESVHGYSASGMIVTDHSVSVAFLSEKDMVFARVALGDKVELILNDKAETIYAKDNG